jgi:DNA polymerase-3 subunit gamma/tau
MSTPLTLAYRPITFADVVGQQHIKPFLREMVRVEKVPPALIFGGIRGTGKTTSARIFAAALNCEKQETGDACGHCPSCESVQQGTSMSVTEIDAASNGGVGEMRDIRDMCLYGHPGRWRVVLLDEAHSMSKEAFNSLLKLLEEPPPNTVFILLTTEVDKILETVQSRSMQFDFRRITPMDIANRLRQIADAESIEVENSLLLEIASRVQGGMRDAVMALSQIDLMGIKTVAAYNELQGVADVSHDLFRAAVQGDLLAGAQIIEQQYRRTGEVLSMTDQLSLLVRDLLILKAGGTPDSPPEVTERRRQLVSEVDTGALTRVVAVLWDLRSRVKSFDFDQRAAMEMGFVLIMETLRPKVQTVTVASPAVRPIQAVEQATDIKTLRGLLAG